MTPVAKWQSYGLSRWRRHALPVLVWLGAVGGVAWMIGQRAARFELLGLARAEQRLIAPLSDGRLALLPVRLFEPVQSGQTLAVLEDDRIRAALVTAAAEVARLRAELHATATRLAAEAGWQEAQYAADARRFATNVEQTRLQILEHTIAIETARVSAQRLALDVERLRRLRAEDAAGQYELDVAEADHTAAVTAVEVNEAARAQLERDLQAALVRQADFARQTPPASALDEALLPLREAVNVQEALLAELSVQQAMLVLRSPLDGVVSELLRGVGEAVQPGEPILMVLAHRPAEVVAYVDAAEADRLPRGTVMELRTLGVGPAARVMRSEVFAVGPAVVELPLQLWRNPSVPEWGCPVRLSIPGGVRLRCDEVVAVRRP